MAFGWLKDAVVGGAKWMAGDQQWYPKQAQIDTARADEERKLGLGARAGQDEYLNWLRAGMAGKGPSVAEKQMIAGREQAIQAAAGQAASARGGQVALANRQAGMNQANLMSNANRDAAMLRASEQMGYGQQFGAGTQAQRAQDILSRGQSIDEARAQLEAIGQRQKLSGDLYKAEAERHQGFAGGVAGAAGAGLLGFAALSDERAKTDILPLTPGQPPIRAAGGMQPAQMAPSFAEQLAGARPGAVEAMDAAKEAQARAEEAERDRMMRQAQEAMANVPTSSAQSGQAAGAGIGGLAKGVTGLLSDREAKEVAYAEGARDAYRMAQQPEIGVVHDETPDKLQRSGFGRLGTALNRASGSAAFRRMSPEERRSVVEATAGIPDLESGSNQRSVAAQDIARRAMERRKALEDFRRDARSLDAATVAPPVRDVVPQASDEGAPGRLASAAGQEESFRGLGEAAQRRMVPNTKRRRYVDEFLSDMRSKQIYSDVRSKMPYSDERAKEVYPELVGRGGSGDIYAGGRGRMPDIIDLDAEDSRRDLGPIRPVVARYKPEFARMQGDDGSLHTQTLAQDHLKSPMYAGTVEKDPQTGMLALDRDRLLKANTAELGGLDKRIRELEAMERSKLQEMRGIERRPRR